MATIRSKVLSGVNTRWSRGCIEWAPNRQTSSQTPQPRHASGSTMAQYLRLPWPWLSTMVTAWAGQARAHFLQPRHISRSTWATQFEETIAPVIPLRRIDCIIPQQQPQQLHM